MATAYWRTDSSVKDVIEAQDAGWSFFQLVRVLLSEKHAFDVPSPEGLSPRSAIRGDDLGADEDIATVLPELLEAYFRFKASHRSDFPPSEICQVRPPVPEKNQNVYEITSIGNHLSGHNGPLPEAVNDWLIREINDGKGHLRRFLDLFNHRLQALRYLFKSMTDYGLTNTDVQRSHFGNLALSLSGHLIPSQRRITGQDAQTLIGLAGGLANRRMTIPLMNLLVETQLGIPVIKVESFIGRWLEVAEEDYSLLGERNQALGEKATLGTRYWDQQAAIALVLGPMPHSKLNDLLPDGKHYPVLVRLLKWLTDCRCDCRVTLEGLHPVTEVAKLADQTAHYSHLNALSRLQGDNDKNNVTFMVNIVGDHQ